MKILFVNSLGSDYGQDILWAGLSETPGVQAYSYPTKPGYFLPLKRYPKNLGYRGGTPWKAFYQAIPWGEIEVVVLGSCKPEALEALIQVRPRLSSKPLFVFNDGGDWPAVGGDFERLGYQKEWQNFLATQSFDLIFKRELLETDSSQEQPPMGPFAADQIRSLPFGVNTNRLPPPGAPAKKYDVSFWAVESDPVRTRALRLLQDQFDCRANGTVLNQKFSRYARRGQAYLEDLARCRIVLNFRGVGWDTLRYWEAPALGCFVISQKPQIKIEHNFEHQKNIVFCQDDLSDLIPLCEHYLAHAKEREQIAAAARRHALTYHSHKARAQFFLNEVQKLRPTSLKFR